MKNEKRRLSVFIAVFTALFLSTALHASASYSDKQDNRSLQWFPSLDANNETIYVVWADERNGNYTRIMNNQPHKSGDIFLSRGSFQDSWAFDKNTRINGIKGSTGHGSPSTAVDSDNIYVVWEDDRFGFEELYFTSSPKNNIKFNRDSQVVEEAGSQVLPSLAVLNRTVYIAMMNKRTWDIDFTEGHPVNGVYRFDGPVRVNDDPQGNWHYAPSLAVDDERNVCIAWLDARNNKYDIYFSHGTKESGAWHFSENIRVHDESSKVSHYTPSIAFDNGSVYIAWYDDRNRDFDIYLLAGRLEDNNWKFGKSIRVNDELKGDQMHPEIAVRNGEIFAVWEDGRENGSDIYFSRGIRDNGSLRFGKNIKVNDIRGKHYDPRIRVVGDRIYVVWQAKVDDAGDIYFSQGRYGGGDWEFGRNIKVNDDMTNSFVKPDPVFLGLILGLVIVSIILVSFFRGKNEK